MAIIIAHIVYMICILLLNYLLTNIFMLDIKRQKLLYQNVYVLKV